MKKWQEYKPKRCWVGDEHKVCYETEEEADGSARIVELEHNLGANSLHSYKCEFGDHWHLANQAPR